MKPHSCEGCPLHSVGKGFTTPFVGTRYPETRVLLVSDSPEMVSATAGEPLAPWSLDGSLLAHYERTSSRWGKQHFAAAELTRCYPPGGALLGRSYSYGAMQHCISSHLRSAIVKLRPRVIVALGDTVAGALTLMTKGKSSRMEYAHGWPMRGTGVAEGMIVVPTFSLKDVRRANPELQDLVRADLEWALDIGSGRAREGMEWSFEAGEMLRHTYLDSPTIDDCIQYFRSWSAATEWLAFDIETPYARATAEDELTLGDSLTDNIISIQFSHTRGTGITMPWREEYREVALEILLRAHKLVGFNNFAFDDPRLKAAGADLSGRTVDAMVAHAFVYSEEPKNLQAVARRWGFPFRWKHLGTASAVYGAVDADATLWAWQGIQEWMQNHFYADGKMFASKATSVG